MLRARDVTARDLARPRVHGSSMEMKYGDGDRRPLLPHSISHRNYIFMSGFSIDFTHVPQLFSVSEAPDGGAPWTMVW